MEACFNKIFPENRYGGPKLKWVIGNTIFYFAVTALLVFATMFIPSTDTGISSYFFLDSCI